MHLTPSDSDDSFEGQGSSVVTSLRQMKERLGPFQFTLKMDQVKNLLCVTDQDFNGQCVSVDTSCNISLSMSFPSNMVGLQTHEQNWGGGRSLPSPEIYLTPPERRKRFC